MSPKEKTAMTRKGVRGRIIYARGPHEVVDLADGALIFDSSGRIVACEPFEHIVRDYRDVAFDHFKHRVIIPGLIDCHLHLPQLDQRGRFGATLIDWLDRYILPAETAFADEAVVMDVGVRFFKKLILNGTTTAAIYSSIHEKSTDLAFELAKAAGIRAVIGKVMMDQYAPSGLLETASESLAASERLCSKWHGKEGGRLRYAFTPRFAPTCSLDLWKNVGASAESSGAYIQSHIAETQRENKLVKDRFPRLPDYFSLFEQTGIAGPRTILGHAIHLSDDEYRRMAKSGTRIAHCPTSNMFLKSGALPMDRIDKAGVVYGLGTDVGAGTSLSLFTEMRHADFTQRDMVVSPVKAFYTATLGGAIALSMDQEVGSFAKGRFADFCVIDIKKVDFYYQLKDLDTVDILSLLMYRGDGHVIDSVYVAGRKLNVDVISDCSK